LWRRGANPWWRTNFGSIVQQIGLDTSKVVISVQIRVEPPSLWAVSPMDTTPRYERVRWGSESSTAYQNLLSKSSKVLRLEVSTNLIKFFGCWWNGRHAGFKTPWGKTRLGSSPRWPTKFCGHAVQTVRTDVGTLAKPRKGRERYPRCPEKV
jgi:hypothetical protein